jgi:hypothetical protein
MARIHSLTAIVVACFVPSLSNAHHSFAEFDFAVTTELDGEIGSVFWRNPHVRLTLRTRDAEGSEQLWELEAQDVNSLGRRGLGADTIKAGDHVKVAGNPSRRTAHSLFVTNVLLPSGTEIRVRGFNTAPRWSTSTAGFVAPTRAEATAEALAGRGIFRVWLRPSFEGEPQDLPLTPVARAAYEAWDPADNPSLRCIGAGMPSGMGGGQIHPIEFVERDGNIVIRIEVFDGERTIHMGADRDPARRPATPMGFSVGRWDGDTLVLHTTRISWPYFDASRGIPQSEAVEIDERFTVLEDTDQLVYDRTVTDPATFTAPVIAQWTYDWHPELVVEPYECTLDD